MWKLKFVVTKGEYEGRYLFDNMVFSKAALPRGSFPERSFKRLKLLIYGPSGAGKTTLAAQFPQPAFLDLEGGTDLYGDIFNFDVQHISTADEAMQALEWLLTHPRSYRTLVIDPITIYWDALQKKYSEIFLRRNKKSKGYKFEFYDFQPRDWATIKAELKEFLRKLITLDLNVIVIARQKVQYDDNGFMKAIGVTFDAEKSLPYLFDTVIRLYRDEDGRFLGECLKDRSGKLPLGEFVSSYSYLEECFGKEMLTRESKPITLATPEQKEEITTYLSDLGVEPGQVVKRLAAYGATSLDELSEDNAAIILGKLQLALANHGKGNSVAKEA